jgi:hypothetical protein
VYPHELVNRIGLGEWRGMDVVPFQEGKVKRKDVYSDSLSILRQVGLL